MTATASMWPKGANSHEAAAMFRRCREAGMSVLRSLAMGRVGGFKDYWARRITIAGGDMSTRTVSRATREAEALGLIKTHFVGPPARGAKPGKEHWPEGATRPVVWGFLHRWTTGWGAARDAVIGLITLAKAEEKVSEKVARARFSSLLRPAPSTPKRNAASYTVEQAAEHAASAERRQRRWTAEELEAEVSKLPPWRPPDEPPDG